MTHYLGGLATVLGRYDEAEAYFAHSADWCERLGAKFFAARTHLLWGRLLADRLAPGDADSARRHLNTSLSVVATNGYANVERHAAERLRLLEG